MNKDNVCYDKSGDGTTGTYRLISPYGARVTNILTSNHNDDDGDGDVCDGESFFFHGHNSH